MAENTKNLEIAVQCLADRASDVCYRVNLPNVFNLSEPVEAIYDSSPFKFKNATWLFRYYSVNESEDGIKRTFSLYLVRLESEEERQRISVAVIGLNADEKYKNNKCGIYTIKRNNVEYKMAGYRNYRLCTDETFHPEGDTLTVIIHIFWEKNSFHMANNDVNTLSDDFKKLLLHGKNPDLILRVADKEFRVHRDILMARSEVFDAMLTHDMSEKNDGVIDVPDCDPQAMEELLLYVYTGQLETLNQENALGLYYLSDKYNMKILKDEVTEYIKLSLCSPMIGGVIQLALNHSDTDLLEYATEYFVNHVNEILPTVGWMSFMQSNSIAANELFLKASKKWVSEKS